MPSTPTHPRLILVVEDDNSLRDIICLVLSKQGYSVAEAVEGRAALGILRTEKVDLLITDLVMPGVEGIELITIARREFPAMPIIAISGAGPATIYLRLAKNLGAGSTLRKPFSVESLLETVNATWGPQQPEVPQTGDCPPPASP